MFKRVGVMVLASCVLLAGCAKEQTPTINNSMTHVMQPEAQTIWDISSHAFNAKGDGLDATKLTPVEWIKLAKAGRKMRDRAKLLADASKVTVTAPGETIMGEQGSGMVSVPPEESRSAASVKQIQTWIDANPTLFAKRARILEEAGDKLLKAAHAKDIQGVYEVSSGMDEVCDGCHEKFWGTDEPPKYPAADAGKWIQLQ